MQVTSPSAPCVVLTSTVIVKGIPFVKRAATDVRVSDYEQALSRWIADPHVSRIVFVENSGYDLTGFQEMADRTNRGEKDVEFISFVVEDFPPEFGKGYGEILALLRAVESSRLLATTGKFVKVTGRYYVSSIRPILQKVSNGVDIVCDMSQNLTYSDSRVFGGSLEFLRDYLCQEGLRVNDSAGIYFEHALARAAHRAIADGKHWALPPCPPVVVGIWGTFDQPWPTSWQYRTTRALFLEAKRLILSR